MNKKVLDPSVRAYLLEHETSNPSDFALKKHPLEEVSTKELVQQLIGLQKSKKKLPTWYNNDQVLFPPKLNLEQTSSEKTADYKASIVSGNKMIDVTGGLGIDSYFFSKKVTTLFHCELNSELQLLAKHNFRALGVANINCHCTDGIDLLVRSKDLDWVYIDPSRRSDAKGKVFLLEDCLPNVVDLMPSIFDHTEHVLIKTAPIYDITEGLRVLKFVKEIHIVAVNNEVKELLWVLKKNYKQEVDFVCVTVEKKQTFINRVPYSELLEASSTFGEVKEYLYEPFAVFMKSGGFDWVSSHYNLNKLHPMSHLYTSNKNIPFAGKSFKVAQVLPYNKKSLKLLTGGRASVVTRNFKINPTVLRKKLKLKEDRERFLFFSTNWQGKQIVIDCQRII